MNTKKSQDFERLSAYVDNQLSLSEKAELEARLAKEPELQAGLRDLQRTVRALRQLPPVKPPRSFTLRPEQVGARARRGPLFPALRLAAALCTLLLGVVVAGDFATNGGLAASTTRDLSAQSGAVTPATVPGAAKVLTPTPEPSVNAFSVNAPEPTQTVGADVAKTPAVRVNMASPSSTATGTGGQAMATGGPTIKTIVPSETPTVSDTPVSVAAVPPAATAQPATAQNAAPQALAPAQGSLRLVEVGLAVLALVLAAATWFTRRG